MLFDVSLISCSNKAIKSPTFWWGLACAALPVTERRQRPAARETAEIEMVLVEVIGARDVRGWGVVFPDEHTISRINGWGDDLHQAVL